MKSLKEQVVELLSRNINSFIASSVVQKYGELLDQKEAIQDNEDYDYDDTVLEELNLDHLIEEEDVGLLAQYSDEIIVYYVAELAEYDYDVLQQLKNAAANIENQLDNLLNKERDIYELNIIADESSQSRSRYLSISMLNTQLDNEFELEIRFSDHRDKHFTGNRATLKYNSDPKDVYKTIAYLLRDFPWNKKHNMKHKKLLRDTINYLDVLMEDLSGQDETIVAGYREELDDAFEDDSMEDAQEATAEFLSDWVMDIANARLRKKLISLAENLQKKLQNNMSDDPEFKKWKRLVSKLIAQRLYENGEEFLKGEDAEKLKRDYKADMSPEEYVELLIDRLQESYEDTILNMLSNEGVITRYLDGYSESITIKDVDFDNMSVEVFRTSSINNATMKDVISESEVDGYFYEPDTRYNSIPTEKLPWISK